jgi:hypothetical protein
MTTGIAQYLAIIAYTGSPIRRAEGWNRAAPNKTVIGDGGK